MPACKLSSAENATPHRHIIFLKQPRLFLRAFLPCEYAEPGAMLTVQRSWECEVVWSGSAYNGPASEAGSDD